MLYANQAGLNYTDFYDNTIAENMRIITAHRMNEYSADVRARMIGYWTLLPHRKEGADIDIYDLWPLRFDPSKEEIERLNLLRLKKQEGELLDLLKSNEERVRQERLYEEQMKHG